MVGDGQRLARIEEQLKVVHRELRDIHGDLREHGSLANRVANLELLLKLLAGAVGGLLLATAPVALDHYISSRREAAMKGPTERPVVVDGRSVGPLTPRLRHAMTPGVASS